MAIPSKVETRLLDTPCDIIASKLSTRLSWLNTYGRVETLTEGKGRDEVTFPAIYDEGKTKRSFISLLPSRSLGNFMFIRPNDSQALSISGNVINIEADIDLVFWFNYEKVYPSDFVNRTIENIKFDVIKEIKKGFSGVRIEWEDLEILEGEDEMFKGYTTDEKSKGFLKRPYGGFVIRTKIYYTEICE